MECPLWSNPLTAKLRIGEQKIERGMSLWSNPLTALFSRQRSADTIFPPLCPGAGPNI